ncbi:neuronal acetylcholine receptor subunit alpha-10-like isoform X2 [Branchiostoma lanceolatum]|uniref:CHRNA10 protein n=2 Tax=Branchiostoma lanceolatum TaxID=7740 RepID=A0A8J9ZCJ6_BRALA|nr:CHRNA10 [Branchiostoma lanceolatum]
MTTNLWLRQRWRDEFLTWNSSEHGNIQTVIIKSDLIWRPDIVLYNRIHEEGWSDTPDTNVRVSSTGDVIWGYPATILSSCVMDISNFPYDVQRCPMKFGSWTYNGNDLNLINFTNKGDTDNFIRNEEWTVQSFEVERNEVVYSCCPGVPFPDVTYTVVIRRRSLYYNYYVMAPNVLLAVLALLGFFLPPDSGEKLSLSITLLLALMVFMQLVTDTLPPLSTSIPAISVFFGAIIVLVGLSSALTIFILTLHFRGPYVRPVPKWLRTIFFLGPPKARTTVINNNKHLHQSGEPEVTQSPRREVNEPSALGRIEKVMNHFRDEEEIITYKRRLEKDWKVLAMRIDRCLFIVFTLVFIIATGAILGTA